ncbi:MAG: LLM class flavin-dependent oxidoreductase [Ilumatobacteraceae bacterium]
MDFAMWAMYNRSWDEALERAQWAEAHHYNAFWYADHLMPYTEDGSTDDGVAHECWTVLAAIGAAVPRLRLVSVVSPVSIHHPVLLAKRAVSTDHISGGRAVLGIGAGWQVSEHTGYGFELLEPGPRVKRFAEAIEIIHRLLHGERLTFDGTYYSLKDAPLGPPPVNGSLPILVGTGSPLMLRLTARFADEWNTWGDPDEIVVRTKRFHTACEKEGRDPATLRRSAQAFVFYVRNAGERAKAEKEAMAGRSIIGSAAEIVEQLGRYKELGIDEFAIADSDFFGETREERTDGYARFHADIVTQLL